MILVDDMQQYASMPIKARIHAQKYPDSDKPIGHYNILL
jgi:hypothetical protein